VGKGWGGGGVCAAFLHIVVVSRGPKLRRQNHCCNRNVLLLSVPMPDGFYQGDTEYKQLLPALSAGL